eukprot:CAMPEP_0118885542 /NCGR_PEP_ID=MMETSP1163-20130328/23958_1 /TAXON_ID=124430 /ORGANISM="Phaeomonas parva, Strain CCMP2877" /LENGTH=161 /DNA_ID=CAMNT_0006823575 /DNA_START=124 /DNA_END=609 /DNA_ORIENTATION=+
MVLQTAVTAAIVICHLYFLLMNFTVERYYCHNPIEDGASAFLIQETYDFSVQHNRLFLERPEWLRQATCVSSYGLSVGFALTLIAALTASWRRLAVPLLLFQGMKMNAIFFYHYMEFTSHVPPENLVPYFATEGPYILAMGLVLFKIVGALSGADPKPKAE